MHTIVTGAAGFIGSNIIKTLNTRGMNRIIAVDNLKHSEKFKNLVNCDIADYLDKEDFLTRLHAGQFDGGVNAILHQGACSNTLETDGHYMMENNFRYSLSLLDWCQERKIPFLYASSAATYGGGNRFVEERACETPLNVYGYSKFLFDQIVRQRLPQAATQIAGFRYFNVYGPHEAHKGRMASVAFHHYHEFHSTGKVELFAGCDGYDDGEQKRDFIHVDDVVRVNLHFLDHPEKSGIFNVGTGHAQSFNELAAANVNACRARQGQPPETLTTLREQGFIEYIPFPDTLRGKYQCFTEADLSKLREAGYEAPFAKVEEGVAKYVHWLDDHV